jgi:hypothetical protein
MLRKGRKLVIQYLFVRLLLLIYIQIQKTTEDDLGMGRAKEDAVELTPAQRETKAALGIKLQAVFSSRKVKLGIRGGQSGKEQKWEQQN